MGHHLHTRNTVACLNVNNIVCDDISILSMLLPGSLRLGVAGYQVSPGSGWVPEERGEEQT